jgi:hypothetical protein
MSSIGMPRVSIPERRDQERPMPSETFLKPTKIALAMGYAQTDHASNSLKAVIEGSDLADYFSGDTDSLPLEGDKVTLIKNNVTSLLGKGASTWTIANIFTQTILLGSAYLEYLNILVRGDSGLKIPYGDFLIPGANLYCEMQKCFNLLSSIASSENPTQKHVEFVKLLGSLAASLIYTGQLALYLYLAELSAKTQLTLSSITYFSSIYQLVAGEYGQTPQAPVFHMRV